MELCTPAHVFLVVSLLFFFFLSYNDYYNVNASCMASYQCTSQKKPVYYYLLVLVLIFIWTWVLNFQCQLGFSLIVWAEIIIPVILMYLGYQMTWNPYASVPYY